MTFADITGNNEVKQALSGMISSGKVPHAIMFHEEDGGGAFPMAMAFLDCLYNGNPRISKLIHPDLHFVFPTAAGSISLQYMDKFRELALGNPCFTEAQMGDVLGIEGKNSMIAVSEARHLLDTLSLSALEGYYRAVVIYLPEKMNQEAANRLLKMIEEPPQMTQFLLITHSPERVLQTIASRCQRIRIVPGGGASASSQDTEDESEIMGRLMSALFSKDLLNVIQAAEEIAALPSRENIKAFCKFAVGRMRQVFLVQQGLGQLSDGDAEAVSWAASCRKSFPRNAMESFSKALQLIERNVNAKIVFTDLADRLYSSF